MCSLPSDEKQVNYSKLSYIEYLRETADFDGQIGFAQRLMNEYEWKADVRKILTKQLDRIVSKHNDEFLNLTVVGEFGTGKSTFINSLLRIEDFLVSSALQGTTVASTIIEYSRTYGITLEYQDGAVREYRFNNIMELKEALVSFTTQADVARGLGNVRIKLPASQLELGFRIVDTPGTNSNERWHEEVTVRTIKEVSDLVLLIVDANKPLSQTFIDFVKTNLSDMMNQCVFLVTRMDMIRKREREEVLRYIGDKVSYDFDIESPLVLPYAAFDIMEDCKGEECTPLATISYETEEKLLYFMKQQKVIAQTKKLVSFMDAMYVNISKQMTDMQKGYKDELELLLRSKQVALEPFIDKQKSKRIENYRKTVISGRPQIVNEFQDMADSACKKILDKIDTVGNLDKLKKFSNDELPQLCFEETQSMIKKADSRSNQVNKWFSDEMHTFIGDFEKLFEDLEILKIDFDNKIVALPEMPQIQTSELADASKYVAKQLSKENRGYAGKAAAGAAIGTAIAPGVGTVIGGVVGFIFGAPKTEKTNAVIANTKEMLKAPLKGYFADVVQKITSNLDLHIGNVEESVSKEIDKYLVAYRETVSGRILTEEEKISQVEKKVNAIRIDIDSIERHKKALNVFVEQINELG